MTSTAVPKLPSLGNWTTNGIARQERKLPSVARRREPWKRPGTILRGPRPSNNQMADDNLPLLIG